MNRIACFLLCLGLFLCPTYSYPQHETPPPHASQQQALQITLGFNGPDIQFPYIDTFYKAQDTFYHAMGSSYPAGARYCHAYLSWDIAEQPAGSGPLHKEGSRNWFEDWLKHAQGHCDRALLSFKQIDEVTQRNAGKYPSISDYETAMIAFFKTNWSYTGWKGAFDFTAWNEPQNGARSGDGLTIEIPAHDAADFYLALRKYCLPSNDCMVAAGDFGSNGQLWQTFVQDCPDDSAPPCANATYMDLYKHWILADAAKYGLTDSFHPEVFAFHGWDDINNYINAGRHCTDPNRCTTSAVLRALTEGAWSQTILWNSEVAAGQNPQADPEPMMQACAASYLLRLTVASKGRIKRIYWTQPYVASGRFFSMFQSDGNPKEAFQVMTERNLSYTPPKGPACP